MKAMEQLRQTGRTTRMLREALRLAREGRAVYVLAASQQERLWHIPPMLSAIDADWKRLGIKIETPASLGENQIDWKGSRLRNAHPNCVLLIDHNAWEAYFFWVLGGVHRFDAEPDAEPVESESQDLDVTLPVRQPSGLRWRVIQYETDHPMVGPARAIARVAPVWEPGFCGEWPNIKTLSFPLGHPAAALLERCSITRESFYLNQLEIPLQ